MPTKVPTGFEISISARGDGTPEAVYIRFSRSRVARTKEIESDSLLADYDARQRLVGIEVLAPVRLSQLTQLVARSQRASFGRFLRQAVPQALVRA